MEQLRLQEDFDLQNAIKMSSREAARLPDIVNVQPEQVSAQILGQLASEPRKELCKMTVQNTKTTRRTGRVPQRANLGQTYWHSS